MHLVKSLIASFFIVSMAGATDGRQTFEPVTLSPRPVQQGYFLTGPHTHKNLSLYFIHDKAQVKIAEYIPLDEALDKGIVLVNETGDVNHLTAENLSPRFHVFIQSGDIVKGGKQDRTIGQDVVLVPKSGKVALNAFCVEQGRWQPRGKEREQQFSSSKKRLSSKELKIAAKKAKSQEAVWKAVEKEQEKLSRKLGKSVKSKVSDTSLQLTLEDRDLQKESGNYVGAITAKGLAADDVVGYAYAVNGTFNTADIYGSNALFKKMWAKALEAAACEAVAAPEPAKPLNPAPGANDIIRQINHAVQGRIDGRFDTKCSSLISREATNGYAFETRTKKGKVIHINVIQK
jgi:hypothetical protein